MNNSEKFANLTENMTQDDYETVRSFIRDTVRAEWGGLIEQLTQQTYPEQTEPEDMPEDPFVAQAPASLVEFLKSLGLIDAGPKGRVGVIHVEFR